MTSSVLQKLALAGALFAAVHGEADETREVVSDKGVTHVVERIDFPAGNIKDIVPAGDKYIIHAEPINSLKDGVAVDALFVMEKGNPNTAFGRTFSTPIHSVAYVPGLDIAVWSYESGYSTNLLEMTCGKSAFQSAESVTGFNVDGYEFDPKSQLFGFKDDVVFEIRSGDDVDASSGQRHEFAYDGNGYIESLRGGSTGLGDDETIVAADEFGVVIARADRPTQLSCYSVTKTKIYKNIDGFECPLSMAKVSSSETEGRLFIENAPGNIQVRCFDANMMGSVDATTSIWEHLAISSMATSQSSNLLLAVSMGTNEVFQANGALTAIDRFNPSVSETGYRKVIADGGDTLLLSNAHSNYFYRVRAR